jgi:hypothetical protein
MGTLLPGTGAAAAAGRPAPAAEPMPGAYGLRDLVGFYQQQLGAINQLWAMYAATTFAAGLFAFNVGNDAQAVALLGAGAIGFFVFDFGHFFMVYYGTLRLKLVAEDIGRLVGAAEGAGGAVPEILRYLARPIRPVEAAIVHLLIDACVFAMFGMQLYRLGQG